MKRRELLLKSGVILSALGLGQVPLLHYQQALAQPTRRKLALLIGINTYSQSVVGESFRDSAPALRGCVTDTDLQRELLIHRFGFQPTDILTLTNQQATRQGIVEAFDQHLRSQAQPGDVVVLHFSGYGSQLRLGQGTDAANTPLKTLVPIDGTLPSAASPWIHDLSEDTLKQLLKTLKAKSVTTVIDAGFIGPDVPLTGGFKVRSRPVYPTGDGFTDLPLLTNILGEKPAVPPLFPGLLLSAARPEQLTIECDWDEINAGLFTYALTRQLWSLAPPVKLIKLMGYTRSSMQQIAAQHPQLSGQRYDETLQPYEGMLPTAKPIDAVVTERNNRTASLWLGGLLPEALPYSDKSWYEPLDSEGMARPGRSRSGLVAQVDLSNLSDTQLQNWSVGTAVIEAIRVLPKEVDLVVAIDQSLARIERVDATSALAALPFISSTTTPSQPADCLFGKPPAEPTQTASLDIAPEETGTKQGYGLFLPTRDLLPGTLASRGEAIKAAITRLTPKLQILLAMKRLRATINTQSSRLAVRLNLTMTSPQEKLLSQRQTLRPELPKSRQAAQLEEQPLPLTVSTGSRLRYQVANFNAVPLYFIFVSLDARDRMLAFVPPPLVPDDESPIPLQNRYIVAPGTTFTLPEADIDWGVEDPIGSVETLLICSTTPFIQATAVLSTLTPKSSSQRVDLGERALALAEAILADLDSGNPDRNTGTASDSYTLNASSWATLAMNYDEVT
ncbi:MAG: caspase family protein [Cyanobacteria bacterium J06632_22]